MDPWGCKVESSVAVSEFEDNFKPSQESTKLADSAEYLAVLGKPLFNLELSGVKLHCDRVIEYC